MTKVPSLSFEVPLSPLEDDVDSIYYDQLRDSQSRSSLESLRLRRGHVADAEALQGFSVAQDGLLVDRNFPLGELEMQPEVIWKRPKDLYKNAEFIVDGATRLDICQGRLYDCWLLSAIASLSMRESLLNKVVPPGQSFQEGYNGTFVFRFWHYGQWKEVRVDDLLPVNKVDNKLIYLSSQDKREFWSPLLEKAYAKLKGGYRALDMGLPHEAMVDMTGGVTNFVNLASFKEDLSVFLKLMLAKGALISCASFQGQPEQKSTWGIVFRHAYSVTAVERVKTSYGNKDLVRVLNPWGKKEWRGPWSDVNGPEWDKVSIEEQQRLHRIIREDGEFWMSVSDFQQHFEMMEVCHLTEGLSDQRAIVEPWSCIMHHGSWVPGMTAGGSPREGIFWQNPQFYFDLSKVHSGRADSDNRCRFIVALMQKYYWRRNISSLIALHIYPAHPVNMYLSANDLKECRPLLCSLEYLQHREVVLCSSLPPGRYIIIPSTFKPNEKGEFLLRVLTEHGSVAIPASKPAPQDVSVRAELSYPHPTALPSPDSVRLMFKKHCDQKGFCKPVHLRSLLTEAIQAGVLAGSEKYLALEHCKSLVALMDNQGAAKLNWSDFQFLWDKITGWTDSFLVADKNKTRRLEFAEIASALKAAGITVDDLVLQLVVLRYTEPNLTITYPGFLYLVMKLESMTQRFQELDMVGKGFITVSYKQWLHATMYN